MFQRRGRSRQISHAALARQASEERRHASSQLDLSSDSPPRSLEDRVHIAYALDDMHLAKVLLLKLKGIHVTDDDDPRIAAVKDEDFDLCFFPHGKLMDEADEKALFEQQRQELQKLQERRREDRLRACERIWEQEKKRLREARALAFKRREAEENRHAEDLVRIRLANEKVARERDAAERRARLSLASRNVVSYVALSTSASAKSHSHEPFVYPFMTPRPTQKLSKVSQPPQSPPQPLPQPYTRPTYDDSRTVAFRDVLASMQGPLFPIEQHTPSPDKRKNELLESLLKVVEWEVNERRKLKGKWTERPTPQRTGSHKSCIACSISSPSVSSSLESSRRSWLSFSSASSSSASTAITTPSTSPPRSSWFSKSMTSSSPVPNTRKRPTSLILSTPPGPLLPPHSCHPHSRFTPILLADSPLTLNEPTPSPLTSPHKSSSPTDQPAKPSPERIMLRRVSQLMELAKEFQNAYVNATLFAIMVSTDAYEHTTSTTTATITAFTPSPSTWGKPKRAGYRALTSDVAVFLSTPTHPHSPSRSRSRSNSPQRRSTHPHAPAIPLQPWRPSTAEHPHTVLPSPLPYSLKFKPIPKPCRSPFSLNIPHRRPSFSSPWAALPIGLGDGGGGGTVTWRVRTVENPVFLRLKALQNVLWEEGVNWQGKAREGSLGAGREKVMKVAFEGVGRSWLGGGAEMACW